MRTLIHLLLNRALRRLLAVAALGVLAAGARLAAEECPEFRPAPERAILAAAEGTFDLGFADGSKGTSSCTLGLGLHGNARERDLLLRRSRACGG